jgi:hypothetical protein
LDKSKGIAESVKMLVTTVARAVNTGMKYEGNKLVATGSAPVLMEPVDLELQLDPDKTYKITVLDHAGTPTGVVFRSSGKRVKLEGSKHRAIYYLIEE